MCHFGPKKGQKVPNMCQSGAFGAFWRILLKKCAIIGTFFADGPISAPKSADFTPPC